MFLPTKRPSAELDLALHEICYATVHDSTNWEKSQAGLVKAWSLFASTLLKTMICKNTLNILLCKNKTCVVLMLVRSPYQTIGKAPILRIVPLLVRTLFIPQQFVGFAILCNIMQCHAITLHLFCSQPFIAQQWKLHRLPQKISDTFFQDIDDKSFFFALLCFRLKRFDKGFW